MSKCEQCLIKQFNNLNSLTHNELKNISESKEIITFKKGEIIFKEGNHANGVYCIKDGICKLSHMNANGKEQIVKFSKKGDLIGYGSVLTDDTLQLTITALNEVSACFIPKTHITTPLKENHKFSNEMFKTVCADLNEATKVLTNISTNTVHQRLAELLLYLEEVYGVDEEGNIQVQLSRNEIGSAVGTATESAIRILSTFKKDQLIALNGKKIKILNKNELKEISLGF